ncbi:hypothetical protein [Collimonas antrihumi]|uniref:hypothetical protein n=1 Tax=Collimonas antrihumi TaxID=1940615 RepID=UPI001B8C1EC8|nr:hypothetical protein [Collimonas antrihumi]
MFKDIIILRRETFKKMQIPGVVSINNSEGRPASLLRGIASILAPSPSSTVSMSSSRVWATYDSQIQINGSAINTGDQWR